MGNTISPEPLDFVLAGGLTVLCYVVLGWPGILLAAAIIVGCATVGTLAMRWVTETDDWAEVETDG